MTVAFALSGGANLGPMQAGSVAALTDAGIVPDLLVGSSVGALNAAFLACRPGAHGVVALRQAWAALRRRDAFRFSLAGALAGFLGMRPHLVSTTRMRALVRRWVTVEQIEDCPTRLAAVATDALTGEPVVLDRGDLVQALLASAAIPGLLPPVHLGKRWLVDGSLAAGCPVLQAQDLGATTVYMISTGTAPRTAPPRGALAMAMHSVSMLTMRAGEAQLRLARQRAAAGGGTVHVVPAARPQAPSPFDFRQAPSLYEAAYDRTAAWLAGERQVPTAG
ncbi:MAG TPA: patatin-like phospholipase family protein [Acidimicrobiales bacterium]|nr:patatin-like phospholipase family protein [Acidimicrobiales bacterium]